MLEFFWLLPLLVLIIGIPYIYYVKGVRFCIGCAYVICVIIFIRFFNLLYGNVAFLSAFVYSAQLFIFGINGNELVQLINSIADRVSVLYIICVWAAFLVCPVLTMGAVLTLIKKGLDRTAIKTRFFKKVFIFTEKNYKSLSLAKDIINNIKNSVVVFTEEDENETDNKILYVSSTPYQVCDMLNGTNDVTLCFNNEDTGMLLDKLSIFLEKGLKRKADIYVFTNNPIAYEVIDGIKKETENHCIKVISTNAILARNILWEYPLFLNMTEKELNVSIFGVGNFGGYFAMNTLWCSNMPDVQFKLNLVDTDSSEHILKRVSSNLPDDYFDIQIFNEDFNTNEFFKKLPDTRMINSNYFLVSTGNDDLNINISRRLRLMFARIGKHPFIITVLKNQSRYNIMKIALEKEDIVITGGVDNIYNCDSILNDKFFKRAFDVYKLVEGNYGHDVTEEDFYKQNQIDIFSSYANAIHCKYKVYSLCESCDVGKEEIDEKLKEKFSAIVEAEHKRWVAFEMLKGYIGVSSDALPEFLENNASVGKVHKNEMLKMHACITDVKGVEYVDKLIKERFGFEQNLKQIDELIARETSSLWLKR